MNRANTRSGRGALGLASSAWHPRKDALEKPVWGMNEAALSGRYTRIGVSLLLLGEGGSGRLFRPEADVIELACPKRRFIQFSLGLLPNIN